MRTPRRWSVRRRGVPLPNRASFCSSHEVVAWKPGRPFPVEFFTSGDVVEEVPVVGDRDHGALVRLEVMLAHRKPGHSASRWFVGSSRRSRSGAESRSRQSATRRRSSTRRGFRRQRVHGAVEVRSRLHASARSMVEPAPRPARPGSASNSASGSANASDSKRSAQLSLLDVAAHVLRLVEVGLLLEEAHGCLRIGTSATPDDGSCSRHDPQERRLPAPFGPSTPIFAPCRNDGETSAPAACVELLGPVHRVDDVAHALPAKWMLKPNPAARSRSWAGHIPAPRRHPARFWHLCEMYSSLLIDARR